MALKVLFLGRLRDAAGAEERAADFHPTVAELIASFEPELAAALGSPKIRVAVNGALGLKALTDGDEVAFLPPVSGG